MHIFGKNILLNGDNMSKELNTKLPLFVYDIFNPPISILDDIYEIADIYENESLVEKIVPITVKDFEEKRRQAYLIYFNDDYCDDAYDIISKSQNSYFTEWNESEISDIKFNILINKNDRYAPKKLPKLPNPKLPYFAYGVFKKGQIAHSRIEKFICDEKEDMPVRHPMGIRDGIPLLFDEKSGRAKGNLIYFNEKDRENAYKIIYNTQSEVFYQWKEIEVEGEPANAAVANKKDKGLSDIIRVDSYDATKDIFFSDVIHLIEKRLNRSKRQTIENFLNLQMAYLLLWVAIERFCILKYGLGGIYDNRQKFANNEEEFLKNLKEIDREYESVFSAKDFNEHFLDKNDPSSSIEYYYAIRCNVAHRGKIPAVVDNESYRMLKSSLNELLNIFKHVLNDSFDKELFEFDDEK